MELFFVPDLSVGKPASLSPDEARHCIKVLRHKEGDTIQLIDGKGGLYAGVIRNTDSSGCAVEIIYRHDHFSDRSYSLHMAVAPTKNIDRFEWFCEKATEVGIDEISPVICTRSERKTVKTERIERVMVAAIKQSIKSWLPKIHEPVDFDDFIQKKFNGYKKFICSGAANPEDNLRKYYSKSENVVIIIGPEGDFTNEELNKASAHNFVHINLGLSRLRTETAAFVACHTINLLNTFVD